MARSDSHDIAAAGAQIVLVNVGGAREVEWSGRTVSTGIYKTPVTWPIRAAGVNLEGDDQADRRVHGGPSKAVYAFPSEHYESWRGAYPSADFGWGAFGENLTTQGILETDVYIGDRFRCGTAELIVTEPRMPCFKLAIRLGEKGAIKRMLETGNTGFYFSIAREGTLEAGDALERIDRLEGAIPVTMLTSIFASKEADAELVQTAAAAPGIPESWRKWLRDRT